MEPEELNKIILHAVPTRGRNKNIYRAEISREVLTRIHVKNFNAQKLWNNFTKLVTLLKIPTGQKPTFTVMEGSVRGEKPPRQPTLRRAAPESARK